MRNIYLGIVSACVLAPSIASAALTLTVPEVSARPGDSGVLEIFFTETGTPTDENLSVYSLGIDLLNANGVSFGPAPRVNVPTDRRFVFADVAGATLEDLGSDADSIRSFASLPLSVLEGVNIGPNNPGVLRIPFTVPVGTAPGLRPVVINTTEIAATDFVDEVGELILFTPDNGFIDVVPEPTALGLLGIGGVLFLRRRRA
jgi:hypothetical protein